MGLIEDTLTAGDIEKLAASISAESGQFVADLRYAASMSFTIAETHIEKQKM